MEGLTLWKIHSIVEQGMAALSRKHVSQYLLDDTSPFFVLSPALNKIWGTFFLRKHQRWRRLSSLLYCLTILFLDFGYGLKALLSKTMQEVWDSDNVLYPTGNER